jgi:hypothetical protein
VSALHYKKIFNQHKNLNNTKEEEEEEEEDML